MPTKFKFWLIRKITKLTSVWQFKSSLYGERQKLLHIVQSYLVLVKLFNLDPMEPISYKQENNTEHPETEITEMVKVSGGSIYLA